MTSSGQDIALRSVRGWISIYGCSSCPVINHSIGAIGLGDPHLPYPIDRTEGTHY